MISLNDSPSAGNSSTSPVTKLRRLSRIRYNCLAATSAIFTVEADMSSSSE